MKVYLNAEGAILQVIPSNIARGSTVTDFEVEAPFSAAAITVRFVLRKGTTDPLLLTRVSSVSSPGLNVWASKLPFAVTEFSGKVPYVIEVQDGDGNVISSPKGTLTITPGTVPTLPSTPGQSSWAQMINYLNAIYNAVTIASITQTAESTEDGGENVWTMELSNGMNYQFIVRNGSKGSKGDNGDQGDQGDDGNTIWISSAYADDMPTYGFTPSILYGYGSHDVQSNDLVVTEDGGMYRITVVRTDPTTGELIRAESQFVCSVKGPKGAQGDPGDPGDDGSTIWVSSVYTEAISGYGFLASDLNAYADRTVQENDLIVTADGGLYRVTVVRKDATTGELLRAESTLVCSLVGPRGPQGPAGAVTSVNGQTGAVSLNAADVGADASGAAATVQTNLGSHTGNKSNPHSVTKSQVGLGNVDNVKQYSASNPPPYPVTSVNGQTGAVTVNGVTVIRETNYEVMETMGTVLDTKMTPAEMLSAMENGGVELHVLSDDGVEWHIYQAYLVGKGGDYAYFSLSDSDGIKTIGINSAADGTMTVAFITYKEVGGTSSGVTKTTLWTGSGNVMINSSSAVTISSSLDLSGYDLIKVKISYSGAYFGGYITCHNTGSGYTGTVATYTNSWDTLQMYVKYNSSTYIGHLYRSPTSSSYIAGSSGASATVTEIIGYKIG